MEIKILGTGCGKCKTTYAVIEKVIKDNNIEAAYIGYLTQPCIAGRCG